MYYIYRITNLINGKTYMGQHKYKKLNDKYMGSGKLLKQAFKKYGKESFKKDIIEFDIPTLELANDWEQMYILFERAKGKGEYNIANGGNGVGTISNETKKKIGEANKGKRHTEEAKRKISEASKRRRHTEETKKKISKSNKNKPKSEEAKKNMSKSWDYDKHFTNETRRKMSESNKGKPSGMKGKHHTKESKKRMSEVHKEKMKEIREAYRKSGRKDWNVFQKEYKEKK